MVARTRCAASPRTRRSSRRRSSVSPTTTSELARAGARRASTRARDLPRAIAVEDVQLAGRRAAPGLGRRRTASTATSRSRSTPDLAHDTEGTLAQARDYWERVDRPNADDQDPGHRRGRAGDRAGDLRGHQRQRHAAVLGRAVRARSPRPTSAGSSAAATRASRSTSHSVASFFVSRVDTEVDKRLEAARQHGARRARPRSPTRAPPTCASRRSSTASASPRCATPGARAAPAVGLDRRQEPALPGDEVRRRAGGAGHREHDADAHAAARPPSSGEVTGATADADPARSSGARGAAPTPASTWTT